LVGTVLDEIIPLPTPEESLNPRGAFDHYAQAVAIIRNGRATEDDAKLLDLAHRLFDKDEGRRASIDARAGSMMSAITLAAGLVTGVGFTTLKSTSDLAGAALLALALTVAVTLVYLSVTAVLVFQIQGRVPRATPDPADVVPPSAAEPSRDPRAVAVKVHEYTVHNYKVNNRVINKLWAAQKCFRNGLITLVVGGFVAILLQWSGDVTPSSGPRLAQALARTAGCTDLPVMTMDSSGVWRGTCLRNGKPAKLRIEPDGTVTFL
jgi:hypothetical protein